MYRFIYMKCVNGTGFKSGLGRKTFEIDLSEHPDVAVWACCGSNGSSKSTFLSLIHPAVWPQARKKFIVEDKEGILVRKYIDTDGTVVTTKCIYKPKKGGGHSASAFFEVEKPGCDPVELNPNGNVTSYDELIYQYFGVNKDFITFATYSNDVANIVRMTDTERKNSVGTLIPNTKRFVSGYNIVNDKYKYLRNFIRNLSQKILSLRDEDSLQSDLNRLTSEMKKLSEEREERIKKLGKMEGELKGLSGGEDINKLMDEYTQLMTRDVSQSKQLMETTSQVLSLYKKLGITPSKPDSIMYPEIDDIPRNVMTYERKLASSRSQYGEYQFRMEQLQKSLGDCQQELRELEASLYSIRTQDIGELKATKKEYENRVASMRYRPTGGAYIGMSYEEIVSFSKIVVQIDRMIHALYDEYGQLVTEFFGSELDPEYPNQYRQLDESLHVTIATRTSKKDQIYQSLIEKQQYMKIAQILDKRPVSCKIDTCPFIAQALKYRSMASEVEQLVSQYKEIGLEIANLEKDAEMNDKRYALYGDAATLMRFINDNIVQVTRYLGSHDIAEIRSRIADGTWDQIFDVMKLKDLAAILSEKALYEDIVENRIPQIDQAIEMAKVYGQNRDLLLSQIERKRALEEDLMKEINSMGMHTGIHEKMIKRYEKSLSRWETLSDLVNRYQKLAMEHLADQELMQKQSDRIARIQELVQKCKEQDAKIQQLDDAIRERHPIREQIKLDLDAVQRLKIEQAEVDRNFTVIEVVRTIMSPNKGIRKELINMYMYDIYQIANQLLLNTFDGKLYLKEFLITDKEFIIPYVFNGVESPDISLASSAQQATITSALSLAILSKLVEKYGVYTPDELDNSMSPDRRDSFIQVLMKQLRYIGIIQTILITQDPERYAGLPNVGFIKFPGGDIDEKSGLDVIVV